MMVALWRVHAHHVTFWRWDSAGVKKIFVSSWAKGLLSLDVVLWKRAIRNLQSNLVQLVSQLSCHFHLRQLPLVFDLNVVTNINWEWFSKVQILVLVPPRSEPTTLLWFHWIPHFKPILQKFSLSILSEIVNLLFDNFKLLIIFAKRLDTLQVDLACLIQVRNRQDRQILLRLI